jgi:hypothetical protein
MWREALPGRMAATRRAGIVLIARSRTEAKPVLSGESGGTIKAGVNRVP